MGTTKSHNDSVETQFEPVEDDPALAALPPEARSLIEEAREGTTRAVTADIGRVGAILAGRLDTIHARLAETKAEIDRIHAHTRAIQADPLNDLLRQAKDRLQRL